MADEDEEETPQMATKDQSLEEKTSSTEGLSQNPVETREDLINTAISFLQNPKVRDGPVSQKKAFLQKKGLTEEEITNAFIQSGTVEHSPQPMVPYPGLPLQPIEQGPVVTPWMRIRETMVAGILVWGVSKAAHKFYTEYVSPYFGIKWPREQRLEVIENSVLEMQNNLVETMKKVQEVVVTVQHQQKQMLVLTEQLLKKMPNSSSISLHHNDQEANEIKAELNSIKVLLLSRKQFPTVPSTSASLPTWQLNTSTPPTVAAATAPEVSEPENRVSKISNNQPGMLPSSSNQISADVEEASTSETLISIEDNKEVDNPNYLLANGGGEEEEEEQQQQQQTEHLEAISKHGSKKSKTKKEDPKKKNDINGFSTDQTNKVDKSHVI